MAPRPVRLEPLFVPRIWGSRNLAPLFPEKKALTQPIGEVWLTGNECRLANGPFAGQKLGDVWPQMSKEWGGERARREELFPVLVKFLFPEDKLSVQVHPDDDYAQRNEAAAGGTGKTEMWYVVSARADAEVRVGFKPEVTKEAFRRAIDDGKAEELIERIPVTGGDAIFVPAGTVHTIGPGMVLCEVQQNSDLTYRVYDFNRRDSLGKSRELHIEKALDVIRFGQAAAGKLPLSRDEHRSGGTTALIECQYFCAAKETFSNAQYSIKRDGRLKISVIVEGSGMIFGAAPEKESLAYDRGQAWIIPAAARECIFESKEQTTLLTVTIPEHA